MPISEDFKNRLYPHLKKIIDCFGTPFHIYDEKGIRSTCQRLQGAFSKLDDFQEFFAVKALPNPAILQIIRDEGFGFDCSSIAELTMSRSIGAKAEDIMFTSNNTSKEDFSCANADGGCILNLDDINLLDKLPEIPERLCFRYNPGDLRSGNEIIGSPAEAKYGVSAKQIEKAYTKAKELGIQRFGIHTMLVSNELNYEYMIETSKMLLDLTRELEKRLSIRFDFVNIGGGLGIPYNPQDPPFNVEAMASEVTAQFKNYKKRQGYTPALYMENGRFMTGPHGVLVTRAINRKEIYRTYIGVDSCMNALMRPAMYGAYHHIEVLGKNNRGEREKVDVVGCLCENNDKFAIQRDLPKIEDGDILIIHDTGAHGHAMGFNYNGQLRPQELLLRPNGNVALIRRAETLEDHFQTLHFEQVTLSL